MQLVASLFPILVSLALANVEKTIFLAPAAINIPPYLPNLDHLKLDVLNPSTASSSSITTQVKASFPTFINLRGTESWFLLENLNPNQRYELRVCWIATVRDPRKYLSFLMKKHVASLFEQRRTYVGPSNLRPFPSTPILFLKSLTIHLWLLLLLHLQKGVKTLRLVNIPSRLSRLAPTRDLSSFFRCLPQQITSPQIIP